MKILAVGMPDSVHFARWLSQFEGQGIKFAVFPSSPLRRIHPLLADLIQAGLVTLPKSLQYLSLPMWVIDRVAGNWLRGFMLAIMALRVKPDLIHIFEFQNAGYVFLRARSMSPVFRSTRVVLTPYGSDIYWFRRFPRHLKKLEALLRAADALSCECSRDQQLAENLGFKGLMLPTVPAFGAVVFPEEKSEPQLRNKIVVKGYQNKWGRAINALSSLKKIEHLLIGYEIHVFSCNKATERFARRWSGRTQLVIKTYPKNSLSHSEVQALFASSLLYIGLSRSDGISASMIEAMTNGSIPIQSNTSCGSEWIQHGKSGYLVDFDDVDGISDLVANIISNPGMREEISDINLELLKVRLNSSNVARIARKTYQVFQNAPKEEFDCIDSKSFED